jgi:hypothetical protein
VIQKHIIHKEYAPSYDQVAAVHVKILPMALPIAPESLRTTKGDECNMQEE